MLEIALVSRSDDWVQKVTLSLLNFVSCLTRYEFVHQLTSTERQKRFDLIVVHHPHAGVDEETYVSFERHLPKTTPVIAIISDKHLECSVQLLNAGIDRCLSESFDESHFSAVVRALTRRSHGLTTSVSQYGALSFNYETKRTCILETEVELTKREAQVLEILLKRVGQIIPKEDFIEEMDAHNLELNASAVEVYIHRLRKKIKSEYLPISNIKRCGYFLRRFDPSRETTTYSSDPFGLVMSW